MSRLQVAIAAAVKRVEDDRTFQMLIHDKKPRREPPKNLKPKNLKPQDLSKRMRESFAGLPTKVVRRSDPNAGSVAVKTLH